MARMVSTHRKDRATKRLEIGEKTKRLKKRRYGGNVVKSTRFKIENYMNVKLLQGREPSK